VTLCIQKIFKTFSPFGLQDYKYESASWDHLVRDSSVVLQACALSGASSFSHINNNIMKASLILDNPCCNDCAEMHQMLVCSAVWLSSCLPSVIAALHLILLTSKAFGPFSFVWL
jgi:hypothetical protein